MNYKDKIAIIGLDCIFPKSDSPESFWKNLIEKKDCITRHTSITKFENGLKLINAYGKLDNIYGFDNEFFNIGSKEAVSIEPQERLFLECAYHALEKSGYANNNEKYEIGIVCGEPENEYYLNHRFSKYQNRFDIETQKFNNSGSSLAARVSYKLNLTGPSIIVNTACSTGLSAIISAVNLIQSGQADIMIAGTTNVCINQDDYVFIENMSSKDGFLRAFDRKSSGFVPGNGIGVVILKSYEKAIHDKDKIFGVINGFGICNDGNEKIGFSAPSSQGEKKAIQKALNMAGLIFSDFDYIETHGTGTVLGDSIEINALNQMYIECNETRKKIPIGSLKCNVGHLNVSAGMAGIIKACLILENQKIPESINYDNPIEELGKSKGLYVYSNTKQSDLQFIKNIGVNSFGIGGMNTHIILSKFNNENVNRNINCTDINQNLEYSLPYVFSAKTDLSLIEYSERLLIYLNNNFDDKLNILYTLLCRRPVYNKKKFFIYNKDSNSIVNGKKYSKEEKIYTVLKNDFYKKYQIYFDSSIFFVIDSKEKLSNKNIHAQYNIIIEDYFKDVKLCEDITTFDNFIGNIWLKESDFDWSFLFQFLKVTNSDIPGYVFNHKDFKYPDSIQISDLRNIETNQLDLETFLQIIKDETEITDITSESDINTLMLDSMTLLGINAILNEKYNKNIELKYFFESKNIYEIYNNISESNNTYLLQKVESEYRELDNLFDNL